MIEDIFGNEENTTEICIGSIRGRIATSTASVVSVEQSKSSLLSIS